MSVNRLIVIAWALILVSWPNPGLHAQTSAETMAAIEAASARWDQEFNSANLDNLMSLYEEDAVSMPPGAPALVGKAAISDDFRGFFEGFEAEHATLNAVLHVAGDTVVERAEYTMTITPKDGSAGEQEEGKHIVVYHRQDDGTWRVMWEIWNPAR